MFDIHGIRMVDVYALVVQPCLPLCTPLCCLGHSSSLGYAPKKKKPKKEKSDVKTSSDSDEERTAKAEARRNIERELKRKVTEIVEDNWALNRQLADEEAKKKRNWLRWLPFAIHIQ